LTWGPRGIVLGLVFLAPASVAAVTVIQFPETTRRIIPAQAMTLMAFLAYAVGAGGGLLFLR
jgi:hypothetical protein